MEAVYAGIGAIVGVFVSMITITKFYVDPKLALMYTKKEVDQLFTTKETCTTKHTFGDGQVAEIKADIKTLVADVKDIMKMVARFFGPEHAIRKPDGN